MEKFKKKVLILRHLLIGAGYFNALTAMEFAAKHHTGLRKDGKTPEFDHQVSIALFAWNLKDLTHREAVIATIFLHDVREDYNITDGEIRALFSDPEFSDRVAKAVERMTKEWRGVKVNEDALFAAMAEDEIASIAKACDRMHNLQSMVGVFSVEKQRSYIDEAKLLFLPMIKAAKRNFPKQTAAYELLKTVLVTQIELIEAGLNA